MPVVNSDVLAGTLTRFRSTFNNHFPAAMVAQQWPSLAMRIESDTLKETHDWFGTVPKMTDVTRGEPVQEDLESYSYTLENKIYKAQTAFKRDAFEDDRLGRLQPKARALAAEAARHPGELIFELFDSGTTDLAFDGVAFFANTRTLGKSANIDNIVSGAYGDGTVAEFQAGLIAAQAQMAGFQDDKGRPMQLHGNVIVVPTALMEVAWQALNRGDGTTGPVPSMPATAFVRFSAGGYDVIANPFLDTADDWYLLHVSSGEARPFIFQSRISPSVDGPVSPNDPEVRDKERMVYSVRGRYVVGFGDPRLAVKVLDV